MGRLPISDRVKISALLSFLLSITFQIVTTLSVRQDGEPYFIKTESNITIHEGDLARLKCRVANLGPKMVNVVVWRKMNMDWPLTIGEMTFSPEDEMSIDHSQLTRTSSTWDLLIKSVKRHHAGIYECQISANHLIAQYITLNVVERSHQRPALSVNGTQYVNVGDKIHLTCNATGSTRAPEAVDWFYEGNRIDQSGPKWQGRVEILRHESFEGKYYISELIIDHSNLEDKGHYVCRSSDLTAGDLKVHVLNAGKDNLTRRLSGNDTQSSQINAAPSSDCRRIKTDTLSVLLLAILAVVWR